MTDYTKLDDLIFKAIKGGGGFSGGWALAAPKGN